jgi:hypothetical protein
MSYAGEEGEVKGERYRIPGKPNQTANYLVEITDNELPFALKRAFTFTI